MARIGIDADGVLLDYNRAFGHQWHGYFGGEIPKVADKSAYHATRYWGIEAPNKAHPFWEHFDRLGWRTMPAMAGAVDACNALAGAGHELICITSMPAHRADVRLANLKMLTFPIARVVATGPASIEGANPKQAAIEKLGLDWMVDDELRKLKDLSSVKTVLVNPGHSDCPNTGQSKDYLSMEVETLSEFAERFLAMSMTPDRVRRSARLA